MAKKNESSPRSASKPTDPERSAPARRRRVLGKTPEGFEVYAPDRPPTLAEPREIRGWIRRWLDDNRRGDNKKAAKAR